MRGTYLCVCMGLGAEKGRTVWDVWADVLIDWIECYVECVQRKKIEDALCG